MRPPPQLTALAALFLFFHLAPTATAADAPPWWNRIYEHRLPIRVQANATPRFNKPVEVAIDLGAESTVNRDSLRLVEIDSDGQVIDDAVPLQFDPAPDAAHHQPTAVTGTLTFLLQGRTSAQATRRYHLYWRAKGGVPFTAPAIAARVSVTADNVVVAGDVACFKIRTPTATYLYGKEGGGFAGIIDRDGNDWISYSHVPRAAGEYHGLPKFGHPEKLFHAGYKGFVSTVTRSGPLCVRIESEHKDGKSACTWNFYPTCATVTLRKFKLPSYWFLYEGTPGGKLDVEHDAVVRANGKRTPLSEAWTDNIPWVYFTSGRTDHALFMASHQRHDKVDSYVAWPFEREADGSFQQMTVFGFGRKGYKELVQHIADLTDLPATYTIGFIDQLDFDHAAPLIESAYKPLVTQVAPVEVRPG
ncbi:MAG TPA: hypothetical protein VH475_02025 [Tepidisphaeraceae bacterium]|jgi:hypothetical protein